MLCAWPPPWPKCSSEPGEDLSGTCSWTRRMMSAGTTTLWTGGGPPGSNSGCPPTGPGVPYRGNSMDSHRFSAGPSVAGQAGPAQDDPGPPSPLLAGLSLASRAVVPVNQSTQVAPSPSSVLHRPKGWPPPQAQGTQDGGMECFQQGAGRVGATPRVATFLLSSFRPSSRKVYLQTRKKL